MGRACQGQNQVREGFNFAGVHVRQVWSVEWLCGQLRVHDAVLVDGRICCHFA